VIVYFWVGLVYTRRNENTYSQLDCILEDSAESMLTSDIHG
jgi:hypothetical protein